MMTNPPLPTGYSPVPPGHVASIVTMLEMRERPRAMAPRPLDRPLSLARIDPTDPGAYRALYRRVGEDWLWFSRLVMPEATLASILADPAVEAFALMDGRRAVGLLELDFRVEGECELAFFGLVKEALGQGIGRHLMDIAIARAWARPIGRLWVHTCTLDSPAALPFYRRAGFVPYGLAVEVAPDPRLTGHLPRSAAPHVPLIGG